MSTVQPISPSVSTSDWFARCLSCQDGDGALLLLGAGFETVRRVAHIHANSWPAHVVEVAPASSFPLTGGRRAAGVAARRSNLDPQPARPCFASACGDRSHVPVEVFRP